MYIRTVGGFSLPISHGQVGFIVIVYKISTRSRAFRKESLLLNSITIEGGLRNDMRHLGGKAQCY